jgi:transcriptional regulator with XRE-family HTH domain
MKKKKTTIDQVSIGNRVKAIRKALGLLQKDFVKVVNINMSTLSDIETGKKRPGSEMLFILSDEYRVNLHYLLHGEGEMFRQEKPLSGIAFADGTFGEYTEDVKELLWYLQHSRLARGGIIAMSKEFCYRNSALIKSEIQNKKDNIIDMEDTKNEK